MTGEIDHDIVFQTPGARRTSNVDILVAEALADGEIDNPAIPLDEEVRAKAQRRIERRAAE